MTDEVRCKWNKHTAVSPGPPDLDTLQAFLQEKADTLGDDVHAHHVKHSTKPAKRATILSAREVRVNLPTELCHSQPETMS